MFFFILQYCVLKHDLEYSSLRAVFCTIMYTCNHTAFRASDQSQHKTLSRTSHSES